MPCCCSGLQVGSDFLAALGGDVDVAIFQDSQGLYTEVALLAVQQNAIMMADLGFGAYHDEGMPAAPFKWTGQVGVGNGGGGGGIGRLYCQCLICRGALYAA